jgi:hypothetical protein
VKLTGGTLVLPWDSIPSTVKKEKKKKKEK